MKRSEVNKIIREAEQFFHDHQWHLPKWCSWSMEQWREHHALCEDVFSRQLGWDVTDFGKGDFLSYGLLLITLRNGTPAAQGTGYAEKIMMVRESQETPLHFHWGKQEDIINRGGGKLVFELYLSTDAEGLAEYPFTITRDGVCLQVEPGVPVILDPGESLTIDSRVYHRFYALKGHGPVLCGEVSLVNDDARDNHFFEEVKRFPELDEDEAPYRLLVGDYASLACP